MATREERVASLASTLRASGLARSDGQARMMAEDMIGVEDSVQKKFDEEHSRAQEYLQTAKNLGQPRYMEKKVDQTTTNNNGFNTQSSSGSQKIEPIKFNNVSSSMNSSQSTSENKQRTVDESAHDSGMFLHPVSNDSGLGNKSLKELMMNQIKDDNREIKSIEEISLEKSKTASIQEPVAPIPQPTLQVKEDLVVPKEAPVLDSKKLTEMMEEDGPLEEKTREIKEKPKDVKPKESYVENSVDLSSMFDFNKK